ncbi:MAG: hypothetical protein ACHBN1_13365 [Heteroscytonema crispum UTEX LB 1556]
MMNEVAIAHLALRTQEVPAPAQQINRPRSGKDVGTIHELSLRSYFGQRRINFHFSV